MLVYNINVCVCPGALTPLFAATAGRLSEGSGGDRLTITVWVKAVVPGDGSILHIEPANVGDTDTLPVSLRMYLSVVDDGVSVTVEEFTEGDPKVTVVADGLDPSSWHNVTVVGSFVAVFVDNWDIWVDGVYDGLYSGYYAVGRDKVNFLDPYLPNECVKFSTSTVSGNAAIPSSGFYIDDVTTTVWNSSNGVVLATYGTPLVLWPVSRTRNLNRGAHRPKCEHLFLFITPVLVTVYFNGT